MSAETFVLTHVGQVRRLGQYLLQSLTFMGGRAWCVTLERVDPKSTYGQMKLLRAIEGEMAKHIGEEREELHEILLAHRFGTKRIELVKGCFIERPARRTSELSREDMSKYIDWVKERAESWGCSRDAIGRVRERLSCAQACDGTTTASAPLSKAPGYPQLEPMHGPTMRRMTSATSSRRSWSRRSPGSPRRGSPDGTSMKLLLPYPVSANRYWRTVVNKKTGRAMTFVSNEAEAYKTEVGLRARVAGWRTPIRGAVELRVTLVPKNGICMDLDNCLKVSIDALKGIVYADDAQVYRIVAERLAPDPRGARLEVDALALELPTPLELPLVPRAEKSAERDTGGLPF
jgi:crossover junction endodeoxyribonuclease RusA